MRPLIHAPGLTAAQLCERFDLSAEGAALLGPEETPGQFRSVLCSNGLHDDAIRLTAHAQPPRALIEWALGCVNRACPDPPPAQKKAVEAAAAWLAEPGDKSRWLAHEAGQKAKLDNPAGCLAAAVFFTGGNIAPPETGQEAPAPEGVAAQLAATAIILASLCGDPEQRESRLESFLSA